MHILIVEDEPSIAEVLVYALNSEGFKTTHHALGRSALAAAQAGDFDFIVLDIGLPDMSGFDFCREIRASTNIPVLFLTARSEEIDRILGLELGADDYVAKPFSPREVVSRIRAILRRTQPTNSSRPQAATRFVVDAPGMRVRYCGQLLPLTRYEYGLLAALLEHPGRVLSRSQLMDTVWQDAEETLERTVDAHIKTLRGKLKQIDADHEPIETHRGLGYSVRNEAL